MMTTFLFVLFWAFVILAGLIWIHLFKFVFELLKRDAYYPYPVEYLYNVKKKLPIILIAIVLTFTAWYIRSMETIQWSLTEKADNLKAYHKYIRTFPNGKYIREAQDRLPILQEENSVLRRDIANKLLMKGISDCFGGKIIGFFISQSPERNFTIRSRFVQSSQWPSDYVQNFLQRAVNDEMKDFSDSIRVNYTQSTHNSPPFPDLTVTFEYMGYYYGSYKLESDLFGQNVRGISVNIKVSLYLPNKQVEEETFSINASPNKKLIFRDPEMMTYSGTMREVIEKNVYGKIRSALRQELGMIEMEKRSEK